MYKFFSKKYRMLLESRDEHQRTVLHWAVLSKQVLTKVLSFFRKFEFFYPLGCASEVCFRTDQGTPERATRQGWSLCTALCYDRW